MFIIDKVNYIIAKSHNVPEYWQKKFDFYNKFIIVYWLFSLHLLNVIDRELHFLITILSYGFLPIVAKREKKVTEEHAPYRLITRSGLYSAKYKKNICLELRY